MRSKPRLVAGFGDHAPRSVAVDVDRSHDSRPGCERSRLLASLAAACTGARTPPRPWAQPGTRPDADLPPAPVTAILVGAGDIADWRGRRRRPRRSDGATARRIAGAVFTAGDNAYFNGNRGGFLELLRARGGGATSRARYPSPGNHEYQVGGGDRTSTISATAPAPRGAGFYSYTLGNWHIVSLNSNVGGQPGPGAVLWLQRGSRGQQDERDCEVHARLLASPAVHVGPERRHQRAHAGRLEPALSNTASTWSINGHDHLYERFAPQDVERPPRRASASSEFIVGTGGAPLYDVRPDRAEQPVQAQGLRRAQADAPRRRLRLGLHRGRDRGALDDLSVQQPLPLTPALPDAVRLNRLLEPHYVIIRSHYGV